MLKVTGIGMRNEKLSLSGQVLVASGALIAFVGMLIWNSATEWTSTSKFIHEVEVSTDEINKTEKEGEQED